ncbi:MAG: PIG-L family deacetylase [Streptosporangiaceae bacterium]
MSGHQGGVPTCLFFHAHPDDESLLTAGTMARLAAEGHRVVLVVATAGEAGLAADRVSLGTVRAGELHESARILGCARVVLLGYRDSGLDGTVPGGFASAPLREAAQRLAEILNEEQADVLTVYDPSGGYGHPDHVQVYLAGIEAARIAGTPSVLEATVDRDRLRPLRWFLPFDLDHAYLPGSEITHRVRIGRHARAKRASMAAHATQASGGSSVRTLAAFLRLPYPLFRLVFGTEYYRQRRS